MKEKTLKEYIASLTPEEREQHQVLIKECEERERVIRENTEKTRNSLEQLIADLQRINEQASAIKGYAKILKEFTYNFHSNFLPALKTLEALAHNKPSMN